MLKTHTCGELSLDQVGQQVTLAGWVNRRRDHGGLVFIDLRDRFGVTQVTIDSDDAAAAHEVANQVRGAIRWSRTSHASKAASSGDTDNTTIALATVVMTIAIMKQVNMTAHIRPETRPVRSADCW